MKRITFELSTASIDKAIKELEAYKNDFANKVERVRQMVAERIQWSAQKGFSTAMLGDTYARLVNGKYQDEEPIIGSSVQVSVDHSNNLSVVWVDGEEAIFIEFGAGVYHNGVAGDSPHPWGIENGYGIGTYGKGYGTKMAWGYREGTDIVLTHGTPAAMPMYNGAEEALRALDDIVKEVFG